MPGYASARLRGTRPLRPPVLVEDPAPIHRRLDGPLFSLVVIAVYTSLGLTAYWNLLWGGSRRLVAQVYGDPAQMVWFFGWTAHAMASGHNPFFSGSVNAPYGMNVAELTFSPLLGTLSAPLTLLAGPVWSVTVCFVLAMPLSATSAFAVLRRWGVWAPAAALGGLAYGFSPFMVNEASQHLNLVFLPLPPLIVAALVKLVTRPAYPAWSGMALGGLLVAQFLISSEILAITAAMSAVGLFLAASRCAARHPHLLRDAMGPALRGMAVAAGMAMALLAYPIWYEFAGPLHYVGPPWPNAPAYNSHLDDFMVSTPRQLLHGASGTRLYLGSYLLEGAYLGSVVLVLVAVLLWLCRRSERVLLAAALGLFAAVLSFGGSAVIHGREVPLPFDGLSRFPALGDILPVRFSFATTACVAALIAFAVDSIRGSGITTAHLSDRRSAGNRRGRLALVAVGVLVGVSWLPAWPFPTRSADPLPPAVTRALPAGDPLVLTYPYPITGHDMAMLWQAASGFRFRLMGVYAMVPQTDGSPGAQSPLMSPPAVQEYLGAEEDADSPYPGVAPRVDVAAETKAFVGRHHVDAVIVNLAARNSGTVARMFTTALGQPELTSRGFEVWDPVEVPERTPTRP